MKKLLFTFATLFVALSAAAATVPTLGFEPSEVSAAPGETVEVKIMLTGEGDPLKGAQLQWYFFNPAHEVLTSFGLEDTNIGNVFQPKYVKFVNGALFGVLNPNCTESAMEDGAFRMIIANLDGSDIFPENILSMCEQAGIEPCLWVIKVQVPANWEDEYATFEFAQTPNYQCMWNMSNGENIDNLQDVAPMVLKIKNANYVPSVKDFLGDVNVTVDQATGAVTATYVPAEGEDVNPTVEVEPSQLTEYGVQNVTVTVSADGYNTKTYTKEVNWVKPNADFQGTVTVTVDENGNITAVYNPAEGEDVNPTVTVNPNKMDDYGTVDVVVTVEAAGYNTKTYNETATWTKPNADFQGTVTVTVDENGNITAVYNPAEGEDVNPTVTVNPNKMDDYGTVDVEVTVEAAGYNTKTYNETATWTKPAPKELTGTLTISDHVNGAFTVTYSGDEAVVINCTITKQGAKESTEGYNLPGYGTYDVYAIATATDPAYEGDYVEATKVLVWEAPQPKEFLGTVDVTVDENGNITVAYVPAEDEVVPEDMTITYDPTKVTEDGTYTVNYTISAEGYNDKTGSAQVTYTKPVVPVEQTNSPSVNKYNEIIWDAPHQCHNEYHISYTNADSDPDATIYYAVGVGTYDEATGTWTFEYQTDENGDTIYMEYVDELIYTTPGTYEITAYAIAPGKTASNTVVDRFTVASTTSVEELFADKTLAGVRYFNLAGQEMQEANGICISVYTFTDGTQVAVKVMQ